ncbi:hypothetical protein ILUMI_05365 [Ignelater luminosus]|uniref:Uncharacterized protein n=1 Tax=Ignelater luminosus TaxID=2038154 RepID=A0A8K0GIR0_IGNLU|nr:hypothetical protein ILUMI_05365 [Ignelater luminosus]
MFNVKSKVNLYAEVIEKKGVKYLKAKDVKVELKPERAEFNFENLFNGDAQLGDAMNKVLNDNWETVYQDVKEPIEDSTATIVRDYANKFLTKVPYDELF